jgi:hypothetical protein
MNDQLPMTKSQGSANSQAPKGRAGTVGWDLGIGISLELGHLPLGICIQDLELCLTTEN